MNLRRLTAFIVLGMFLMTAFTIMASGEPSLKNPRRQDAVWIEENVKYDMTYLTNGQVSLRIISPDIFELNGTGTIVIWQTVWTEGEDMPVQQHIVMKIVNGEIVSKRINDLGKRASLKATNNSAPNDDDNELEKNSHESSDSFLPKNENKINENWREYRQMLLKLIFHFSSHSPSND